MYSTSDLHDYEKKLIHFLMSCPKKKFHEESSENFWSKMIALALKTLQ